MRGLIWVNPLRARPHWLIALVVAVLVTLIVATVVAMDVYEHGPLTIGKLDWEFVGEALLLGLVVPLGVAKALGRLGQRRTRHKSSAFARANADPNLRVLVIENELMGGLMSHLLRKQPDLHVVGAVPRDAAALSDAIRQMRPDVVVMSEGTVLLGSDGERTLAKVLEDFTSLRLITMNAEDERVHVHVVRQVRVTGSKELLSLVHGQ